MLKSLVCAVALALAVPAHAEGDPIIINKQRPAPQEPTPIIIEWLKALLKG